MNALLERELAGIPKSAGRLRILIKRYKFPKFAIVALAVEPSPFCKAHGFSHEMGIVPYRHGKVGSGSPFLIVEMQSIVRFPPQLTFSWLRQRMPNFVALSRKRSADILVARPCTLGISPQKRASVWIRECCRRNAWMAEIFRNSATLE